MSRSILTPLNMNSLGISSLADGVNPQDAATVAQLNAAINARYSTTIGDGVATTYTVTHNLNTRDVGVEVYYASANYDDVFVSVRRATVNTLTLTFLAAPSSNSLRVVVTGVGTVMADGSLHITPVTKTISYTVASTDHMLVANHATTSVVFSLPPATGSGRVLSFSNIGASDAMADGDGTDKINNEPTQTVPQWNTLTIWDVATGTWSII